MGSMPVSYDYFLVRIGRKMGQTASIRLDYDVIEANEPTGSITQPDNIPRKTL